MHNINIRTDLALESREMLQNSESGELKGIESNEYYDKEIKITEVKILDDEGSKRIGKPKGTYITLEIPDLSEYNEDVFGEITEALSNNLKYVLPEKYVSVLVVGLGNWNITPDSLGPKVISSIMVTKHFIDLMPNKIDERINSVSAISPGVLGITGMETSDIIKGVVEKTNPDLVVCIDALTARSLERVNKTIQISTSGINPGAGVGNKRKEISISTLGVPVIAIGVPTVIDASTMANDTIDIVLDELIENSDPNGKFYDLLNKIDRDDKEILIKEVLNPFYGELIVTPKEVDSVINNLTKVISMGINKALQPELTEDEISIFIN